MLSCDGGNWIDIDQLSADSWRMYLLTIIWLLTECWLIIGWYISQVLTASWRTIYIFWLSIECQSTECQSTIDQVSTNVWWIIGEVSAKCWQGVNALKAMLANYWPSLDWLSTNCQATIDCLSTDYWLTVIWYINWLLTNISVESTYVKHDPKRLGLRKETIGGTGLGINEGLVKTIRPLAVVFIWVIGVNLTTLCSLFVHSKLELLV